MVTTYMFNRIRELSSQGMKIRAIARELGLDRKTVGRYLKVNAPPSYKERSVQSRQDPCKPFMEAIGAMLKAAPDAKAYDIYSLLQEQGYTGSMRTLERRIASIKGELPKERFFEQNIPLANKLSSTLRKKSRFPLLTAKESLTSITGPFHLATFFP